MCSPCGLSDNLKLRSHCSNSSAGSRSTETQSCCKTFVALIDRLEKKILFKPGCKCNVLDLSELSLKSFSDTLSMF